MSGAPLHVTPAQGMTITRQGRLVFCSFSGGESSAEMVLRVKERLRPDDVLLVLFANTGQEDDRTLIFIDRCDREYDLGVVYLEAVVDPRLRKVTTHRIVTFETATRDESLFEAMIRKYGIPNKGFPHCTRELKLRPMASYLASIGWVQGTHTTCIGIRADEMDRFDLHAREKGYVYPLAQAGMRKADVHRAWDARPFQLGLREHEGNCKTCWKKSFRKLMTLAVEQPLSFEPFRHFEAEYAHAGAGDMARTFFRGGKSVDDIFAMAAQGFESFVDTRGQEPPPLFDTTTWDDLDLGGACGESCEPYGDEASPELEAPTPAQPEPRP